ncbi:Rrf2 family transcriptional regulator [Acetobacter persici]|uniref:Rrf2 family transcriptional regulator n=1 Tax=Acetobacter persici TaxID=1076596 RepID=UPI001BA940C5|nr:Rrf2 family transcriptional regulator [Acetobacter persici]MBS1000162.1 Rrf2 family transcriptional regulator [Acetobacter persici]
MRQDNRLSCVLHVLLHMAEAGGPMTSEALARALNTNPVVVRRLMGGLREHGYVHSEKGHGGGWTLSCQLDRVTLRDIYEALDAPRLFAIGNRSEKTECLVEEAVNHAMSGVLADVTAQLLARFGQITLAALHADFHQRLAARHAPAMLCK